MERAPARPVAPRQQPLAWKAIGLYLPLAAFALAAFLVFRDWRGEGAPSPSPVQVDPGHAERLAANIAFFEGRVAETNDSLSYNRLTALYLQRLRETGDVSDVRRAETSATRSLEVAPGQYAGLVALAQVRIAQHEFTAAETAAREALALAPSRADAQAVLGDALMALGRYDAAGDAYRTFLEKAPGSSAFARMAAYAEVNGNVPLADQYWRAAIDVDRGDAPEASAWARVQLANLLFVTGKTGAARDEYALALRVFPGYGPAEAGLGRVAAARGDDDQAIAHYTRAIASVPLPEYVAPLADILARSGDERGAARQAALMSAFDQLFAANGIKNDLTLILFDLDHGGDTGRALDLARAAYAERPSLAAADTYAWALYRAGQLDEARAMAEVALSRGTREPLFLYHAGAIAFAQGDDGAAAGWLQQVRDLNPAFSVQHQDEAARLLAQTKERAK